jgi:hypothetical protein
MSLLTEGRITISSNACFASANLNSPTKHSHKIEAANNQQRKREKKSTKEKKPTNFPETLIRSNESTNLILWKSVR